MPAPPPPVIHAQNPVSVDSQEIDVEPSQSNEEFIDYLELTDYFVMSAERIPTSKWDTPANVTVVTADEIEKNHYQTVAEALSHVNGVVITGIGTTGTSGFVNINGSNRVLLLIDGHRANSSQDPYVGGGYLLNSTARGRGLCDLSLIPSVKIIDRIEIVKGGASALYGSDAVSGIVNVITKKGERNETEIDVNYGSWHRYNLEATNQGVKDSWSWFVTAGLGGSDAYDINRTNIGGVLNANLRTDYRDRDLSIRIDNQISDRSSITLNHMHRTNDYADDATNSGYYAIDYYKVYNDSSVEYRFKEDTSTPGWLRYFNNYEKGYDPGNTYNYGNSRIQGVEYQNGWELGKHHKLIAGIEWHRAEVEIHAYELDHRVDSIASYLQDTISLGNKWTVVPGIRYDHTKDFSGNWSPKLAANYRADDKTKIYASWGRTYSIPTIGELYMFNINKGNPNAWIYWAGGTYNYNAEGYNRMGLKPETGHSENIGIEHNFDDKTSVSVNFFNNVLKDVVNWSDSSFLYPSGYYDDVFFRTNNDLTQKRRGVEFTFKQNLSDRWSYDLGYSHTQVRNVLPNNEDSYFGQPNGYRVGVHYNVGKWRANLLGVMASGLDTSNMFVYNANGADQYRYGYISKSYAVLDFNTSYDFTDRLSLYFRTLNFTNEDYSNDDRYIPAPGRSVQIGATYKF